MSLQIEAQITDLSNKIVELLEKNGKLMHNAYYYANNRILSEYQIYITIDPSIEDLISIEEDLITLESEIGEEY